MNVEKFSDELWIGVKGQTNLEIAGSPRNIFRYSLAKLSNGGRALKELGGLPIYQTLSNFECYNFRVQESDYGR